MFVNYCLQCTCAVDVLTHAFCFLSWRPGGALLWAWLVVCWWLLSTLLFQRPSPLPCCSAGRLPQRARTSHRRPISWPPTGYGRFYPCLLATRFSMETRQGLIPLVSGIVDQGSFCGGQWILCLPISTEDLVACNTRCLSMAIPWQTDRMNTWSAVLCECGWSAVLCECGWSAVLCECGMSAVLCECGMSAVLCECGMSAVLCECGMSAVLCECGMSAVLCECGMNSPVPLTWMKKYILHVFYGQKLLYLQIK